MLMTRRTFTGAWIETPSVWNDVIIEFVAPLRVRGLKQCYPMEHGTIQCRTFTGAWIETNMPCVAVCSKSSRTFTGAWIETYILQMIKINITSHLYGCVD